MREWIFAVVLFVAGCLVVRGVADLSSEGAWITAGGVLAGWGWLVLADDGDGESA